MHAAKREHKFHNILVFETSLLLHVICLISAIW